MCSTALGLNLNQINAVNEIILINQGGISEQIVGQLLRVIVPPYIEPALYYWHRDVPGSAAEVDYVIQQGSQLIPIEVKAGKTGSLKSLHLFMGLKKLPLALRINSDYPSETTVNIKLENKTVNTPQYQLLSIPFYLIEQIPRLVASQKMSPRLHKYVFSVR